MRKRNHFCSLPNSVNGMHTNSDTQLHKLCINFGLRLRLSTPSRGGQRHGATWSTRRIDILDNHYVSIVLTLHSSVVKTLTSSVSPTFESLWSPVNCGLISRRYRPRSELCCHWHVSITKKYNLKHEKNALYLSNSSSHNEPTKLWHLVRRINVRVNLLWAEIYTFWLKNSPFGQKIKSYEKNIFIIINNLYITVP